MDISIVQASPDDASEILSLQKIAYQSEAELNDDWTIPPLTETLPEIISEFEAKVFLKAVCEDKIVGSVRAALDSGTCQVGRLIVHPDYQGKGIGTLLIGRIETRFSLAERFELFTGIKALTISGSTKGLDIESTARRTFRPKSDSCLWRNDDELHTWQN